MCIIVAKKSGIKMPSAATISTCFENNPDGAGLMLACKNKVWGFKGLMTLDALNDKLKLLTKRFGSLDDMSVVMHFRIGTHGSNIPENTHPFPLLDNYAELRELEWCSTQGVAHNGIISACSYHKDIKAENVSDTMVFVKRVIAPIAKNTRITKRQDILSGLGLMADSKLAFLDWKGNVKTAGDFVTSEGVLYSNSTYKEERYVYTNNWRRYYGEPKYRWNSETKSWSKNTYDYIPKLTAKENENYREEERAACGYESCNGWIIRDMSSKTPPRTITLTENNAIDCSDGTLYAWDSKGLEWDLMLFPEEYEFVGDEEEILEEELPELWRLKEIEEEEQPK